MRSGLPFSTTISSEFVAKATDSPWSRPASVTFAMFFTSAEAKTSAGRPCEICSAKSEDEAKLKAMVISGFASMNCSPMSLKTSVSDEVAAMRSEVVVSSDEAHPAKTNPKMGTITKDARRRIRGVYGEKLRLVNN